MSTSTIVELVGAELRARGQRVQLIESPPRARRFRGERLVELHLEDPRGTPELVIDTRTESPADAAETVLAYIDGYALA